MANETLHWAILIGAVASPFITAAALGCYISVSDWLFERKIAAIVAARAKEAA